MNHQDDASVTEGPFSKDPGLGFRYRRRRLRPGQTVLPGEAGLMLTGQQTMTLPAGSCRPPFPATNTRFYHVATDALPNEPDIGEKDWTTIDSTGAQGTVLMTGDLRSGAFGTGPPQDVGCVSSPFTRIKDQGLAKNSMGARTVARMAAFDMVRRAGRDGDLLAVRAALAPLNAARAGRLPTSARRYHDRITANTMPTVRFSLGKLHVTPGAVTALARTGTDPATLLDRHQHGDWGHVDIDEALANNDAVDSGALLHSIYDLDPAAGLTVWVLTEGDRRTTTITTPEY